MNRWIISPVEKGTTHDPRNDPPKHGVQYRVLRFCETVKGFHTVGSLYSVRWIRNSTQLRAR